jgi:hypothetical protein
VTARRRGAAALAGYLLVAFLVLGLGPLVEGGPQYVGYGYDPQIFIWAFAWWPHAILHGQNPFVTHAVWAPGAVDLAWSTSVPALALAFAPLTLLAGPTVSYDVAAVLMPALAAWTAFMLCRYLTRSSWPSLVGGYLFGFSSYLLAAGGGGHLHLSSVFLLPLVPLVVLRYLNGELAARGLVLRLGPLLALQLLCSTEIEFTLALALAASLLVAFAVAPARRPRILSLLLPLTASYAAAAVLAGPFVYFLLSGFHSSQFNDPDRFVADLANLVVPTKITAIGGTWLRSVSNRFPGNGSEQGLYLGLPVLAIVALFARERWRSAGGRFLLVCLGLGLLVALGARLTVAGHRMVWLPWSLLHARPLFDNVLTVRIALYTALASAVVVALWTSRRRGAARYVLPGLAVLALVPDPSSGGFATTYSVPAFFTSSRYRDCLDPGETVVPFPFRGGSSLLSQVDRGFRWRLAGGDIGPEVPARFLTPDALPVVGGGPLGAADVANLRTFLAAHGVTTVVVDAREQASWAGALDAIARPQPVGGVVLYRLTRYPPPCGA